MKFLLSLSLKVRIIIAVCVAAAAAVTVAVIINSKDAYRVIKVFEIEGEAVVTRENTGELEAYEGMNLESGDVLSVGAGSYMRISLDGDKYILLDSGTVLEIIAKGSAKDSRTTVNLKEGTILNEITNTLSSNSSYEVNTPKATMAVRGTSFKVTVTKADDGGYITDIDTIQGKVLVRLYDEDGNLKDIEAFVTEGNRVTILTDPNYETGNDPEVDGNAYFVFRKDGDTFIICEDSDPAYLSDYSFFSEIVRNVALNSNDSNLLLLDKKIADKLRGNDTDVGGAFAVIETSAVITGKTDEETRPETSDTTYVSEDAASVDLPVQYIPAVTTVPTETTSEQNPVIPSELTIVSDTAPLIAEISEAASTITTDTEKTSAENSMSEIMVHTRNTAAKTTAAESSFYTYMPPIISATTVTSYTESSAVSVTPSVSITTSTSENVTPSETATETTIESPPTVYNVSFVDSDGGIISLLEIEDNCQIGSLPMIMEKKGYTAKWVSGGTEVTEATVINADMEITAEYTPRPVTIQVYAPHSNDPFNTYDVVREFTVLYDDKLTDNAEGLTLESLTEYVESLYAKYFEDNGKVSELSFISFDGGIGEDIVSDSSIIAGDNVYDDGEKLCIQICFNYKRAD